MDEVAILAPVERPRIDPGRIEKLCEEIGPYAIEDMVCRAMEELAHLLCRIHDQTEPDRRADLCKSLRAIRSLSDQVGLNGISRIAEDVLICIDHGDPVAEAAVMARLARNGERSLAALWDLQGMSI